MRSSIDFDLGGTEIENLTLVSGAFKGTGNGFNNIITGNGDANTLDGAAGIDTLIGGDGNDLYIVDSKTDKLVELANRVTIPSNRPWTLCWRRISTGLNSILAP